MLYRDFVKSEQSVKSHKQTMSNQPGKLILKWQQTIRPLIKNEAAEAVWCSDYDPNKFKKDNVKLNPNINYFYKVII